MLENGGAMLFLCTPPPTSTTVYMQIFISRDQCRRVVSVVYLISYILNMTLFQNK